MFWDIVALLGLASVVLLWWHFEATDRRYHQRRIARLRDKQLNRNQPKKPSDKANSHNNN